MTTAFRLVECELAPRTATKPASELAQTIAGEMWRVSSMYGFHPGKDAVENDDLRQEFARRIERFMVEQGLKYMNFATLPRTTLALVFGRYGGKTKSHCRAELITIEEVNELALVFALVFLRLSYVGLPYKTGVEKLKEEVVWLLAGFHYKMPPVRNLLCPVHSDWKPLIYLWCIVRDFNAQSKGSYEAPSFQEFSESKCSTCTIMCKVAR